MGGSVMTLRCPCFSLRLFPESQVISLLIQTMLQILHGLFSVYEHNTDRSGTAFIICIDLEGNGTPLQYSCLENPMGAGAWWAAVLGDPRSRT